MNHYEELVKHLTMSTDNHSSKFDLQHLNEIVRYIEKVEKEATANGVLKGLEMQPELFNIPDRVYLIHEGFNKYLDDKIALTEQKANEFANKGFGRVVKEIDVLKDNMVERRNEIFIVHDNSGVPRMATYREDKAAKFCNENLSYSWVGILIK